MIIIATSTRLNLNRNSSHPHHYITNDGANNSTVEFVEEPKVSGWKDCWQDFRCTRLVIAVVVILVILKTRSAGKSSQSHSASTTNNTRDSYRPTYFPTVDRGNFAKNTNYNTKYSMEIESCTTWECKNAVEEIINSLNTSVHPCDNFYEFACQGWQMNNPPPSYSPDWNVFSKLDKKTSGIVAEILSESSDSKLNDFSALNQAKTFYQSCMEDLDSRENMEETPFNQSINSKPNKDRKDNNAAYKVMLKTLEKYGGWPALYKRGTWNSSRFDLTNLLIASKSLLASPMLLDVISHEGLLSNSILLSRPSSYKSLVNPVVDPDDQGLKLLVGLRDFIVNISREMLILEGNATIDEARLSLMAWEIILVKYDLGEAAEEKVNPYFKGIYGITKNFLKTDVANLQYILDAYAKPYFKNSIRVDKLLAGVAGITVRRLGRTQEIVVTDIDYLLSTSRLVTKLDKETLANYLMFYMLIKMIPYSSSPKLIRILNDFSNDLYGTTGEPPHQEVCVEITTKKFPLAVGYPYVKRMNFNHLSEVENIFDGVKQVFDNMITWSSKSHLNKTMLSAEVIVTSLCLGYPAWILNKNKVENEYSGLTLNQNTFLEKLMAVNKWSTGKQFETLFKTDIYGLFGIRNMMPKCKWTRFIGTIGAFNELSRFLVYLPLGMLQKPFYNVGLPRAFNYGSIGSILGHEVVHGFVGPDEGMSEFKDGSLTPSSKCLVNLYENLTTEEMKEKNVTLNGTVTLHENIPDSVGLLGAYKALKLTTRKGTIPKNLQSYTEDQLFFLGFAQNWCQTTTPEAFLKTIDSDKHGPDMFRVLGTLKNSKEFAQAWKCPVGSNMNPDPKIQSKCLFF